MPLKARRCLTFLVLPLFLSAGIALAQKDGSVSRKGHTVTGRVVDSEGRPLSGVEIWRPYTEQERLGRAERRPAAVSGPDGLFTVTDLRPTESLTACPLGWQFTEIPSSDTYKKPVEFRLQPAARMAGRVVDARGEPVPGVDVTAQLAGWVTGCLIMSPPEPCLGNPNYRSRLTDVDGRFVFEALKPGWFVIRASNGNQAHVVRWQVLPGKNGREVEVALPAKLVPLEGRVVDADGKPVSGAQVSNTSVRPDSQMTNEDGVYRFPRVLSGDYLLEVSHPDLGWIQKRIQIGESPARIDIRMPVATVVEGRVFGPGGSPIPKPRLSVDFKDVELDPEGNFRFNVSTGEHAVRVEAVGWITAEIPLTATGDPIELNIQLSRPATISGRITGLPPGERGALNLIEGPRERPNGTGADEDNTFRIHNVAPGTWTLLATDSNGRTLKQRVQVEEAREITVEDFEFPPLPLVRGRVLDPEGRATKESQVVFNRGWRQIYTQADAEGRFTAYLADGTWTVKAQQEGFGSAAATVTVAGSPADVPDIRLFRPATVSGYIRGLAPGEVPLVEARSDDGLWVRGASADQESLFQIPDLSPGNWTIVAFIGERQASTQVRILPGDAAVRADVSFGED